MKYLILLLLINTIYINSNAQESKKFIANYSFKRTISNNISTNLTIPKLENEKFDTSTFIKSLNLDLKYSCKIECIGLEKNSLIRHYQFNSVGKMVSFDFNEINYIYSTKLYKLKEGKLIDLKTEKSFSSTFVLFDDVKPTIREKQILGYKCKVYQSKVDENTEYYVSDKFDKSLNPGFVLNNQKGGILGIHSKNLNIILESINVIK